MKRNTLLHLFVMALAFVFATCGGGSGSSSPGTHDQPPIVATTAADNIGTHSATLHGTVNPNGLSTTYQFDYGTSSALIGSTRTPARSAGSGITSISVSETVTGLADNTTYYFREVAESSAGNVIAAILAYKTGAVYSPPTVQALGASGISQTGGTINGQVNPNGVATNGRFRWGYGAANLTNFTPWVALGSGTTSVAINFNITGQASGITIYYQAEGNSTAGNSLSATLSFTTLLPNLPPTVTTLGATGISQSGGTINGLVNPNSVATNGRFRWGFTATTLTNPTPWVSVGAGATDMSMSFNLTGQSPSTPIYYQAEGDSAGGNVLGAVANFTTSLAVSAPTATTGAYNNVTISSADVAFTVNPNNDPTSACIEWSVASDLSSYSSTPTQFVGADSTSHNLSATLAGLTDSTTIYYRVRAWNSLGTVRGQILSFTTLVNIVTINGTLTSLHSHVIFRNNQQVYRADGVASYQYQGSPGNYKIIYIPGSNSAAGKPYTIVTPDDNNVFQLPAGAVINLNYPDIVRTGRIAFNITGSGWTSSYQAPANVGGIPAWTVTTVATGSNFPVTSPSIVTATYSQTENLVTFPDPSLGTVNGTMNGDLLYFWAYAWNGAEVVAYRETVTVNATGNYFAGDVRIDLTGTSRWVTGNVTATR